MVFLCPQKLLWIVSQTLQRNQVDGKHPKFKDYATVMAKVVKRFYLESPQLRSASSVSEQMAKYDELLLASNCESST